MSNLKSVRIKALAAVPGESRNGRLYTPEVLQASVPDWPGKLLLLDHDRENVAEKAVGITYSSKYGVDKTSSGEEKEGLWLEAFARVGDELYQKMVGGKNIPAIIKHVSIGAEGEAKPMVNALTGHRVDKIESLSPIEFSMISVPGIPEAHMAKIELLEEAYRKGEVQDLVEVKTIEYYSSTIRKELGMNLLPEKKFMTVSEWNEARRCPSCGANHSAAEPHMPQAPDVMHPAKPPMNAAIAPWMTPSQVDRSFGNTNVPVRKPFTPFVKSTPTSPQTSYSGPVNTKEGIPVKKDDVPMSPDSKKYPTNTQVGIWPGRKPYPQEVDVTLPMTKAPLPISFNHETVPEYIPHTHKVERTMDYKPEQSPLLNIPVRNNVTGNIENSLAPQVAQYAKRRNEREDIMIPESDEFICKEDEDMLDELFSVPDEDFASYEASVWIELIKVDTPYSILYGGETTFGEAKQSFADAKNWIKGAIKKPGSLRKALGITGDKPIPSGMLKAAAKKAGKIGQKARLALTLIKLRGKKRKK